MDSQSKRILVADDEEAIRTFLAVLLTHLGHEVILAKSGEEALQLLNSSISLVLLDVRMGGISGFETARRIRSGKVVPDVPIVMVTAETTREDRLHAVEAGASDFIAKPVDSTELRVRTDSLLRLKEAQDEVKRYTVELEDRVARRTAALLASLAETRDAHQDTLRRLAIAAEYKDADTAAHIFRVSEFAAILAHAAGLGSIEVEKIRHATPMHDIGKIGIPDGILLKPGRLTPEERRVMEEHTLIGARILADSPSELLQAGSVIALTHHERWDGKGYPNGLAGEAIPLSGRICALADVFDALCSKRSYKKALSLDDALGVIDSTIGSQFDPMLGGLFLEQRSQLKTIQESCGGGCTAFAKRAV